MTGAGSGGHITPILAVAHELKQLSPDSKIIFIGQKGHSLSDIPEKSEDIDKVYNIHAGKFRRYHNAGFAQLIDIPTLIKNIRDIFLILIGTLQGYFLLGKIKPDAIFIKGGYIGVPVGLGAAARHIPYLTHDSDSIPGLANRIIARWAALHTTALPKEYYPYSPENTEMVGVPISADYKPVSSDQKESFKKSLGLEKYKKILLVTGGGQGAVAINEMVVAMLSGLLKEQKELAVIHFVGRNNESEMMQKYNSVLTVEEKSRVVIKTWAQDFYRYSGAADLIIARAGATNMAEFAAQGKACIVIPNPFLVSGHQLKNAQALANENAIEVVTEDQDPDSLRKVVEKLLNSSEKRKELGTNFHKTAIHDSAKRLAVLLLGLTIK